MQLIQIQAPRSDKYLPYRTSSRSQLIDLKCEITKSNPHDNGLFFPKVRKENLATNALDQIILLPFIQLNSKIFLILKQESKKQALLSIPFKDIDLNISDHIHSTQSVMNQIQKYVSHTQLAGTDMLLTDISNNKTLICSYEVTDLSIEDLPLNFTAIELTDALKHMLYDQNISKILQIIFSLNIYNALIY